MKGLIIGLLLDKKYIGVYKAKKSNKWHAKAGNNYKEVYLGTYDTAEEAAKAYDDYVYQTRGKGATFNLRNNEHYCEAPNCKNKAITCFRDFWVCQKHKAQLVKHGKFLERTIRDLNEIIIDGDFAYIVLYNIKSEEVGRAKIDAKYVDLVKDYKWYLRPDGYVATMNYNGKYQYLHLVIAEKLSKPFIDHKNRNKLDNTESNLREATGIENNRNKSLSTRNTSGKVGVSWSKQRRKWVAFIQYNGKNRNLGGFEKFEDAVACRVAAEKRIFGDFRADV